MNIKPTLGIVLLSILIINLWKNTMEGIYSPASINTKHTFMQKIIHTICEGGFLLPGFPDTM